MNKSQVYRKTELKTQSSFEFHHTSFPVIILHEWKIVYTVWANTDTLSSPWFLFWFTFWAIHFIDFNKSIILCIHFWSFLQNRLTVLKILWSIRSLLTTLLLKFWQSQLFFPALMVLTFPRLIHSWNHTVCNLFGSASVFRNTH